MDETRDLIESAQNLSAKKDVLEAVEYLYAKNVEEAFPILKDIFFHPLTNNEIRKEVGRLIAQTKNEQIYNLLISHLILRNFSDLASIIFTLGEYRKPEIFDILLREYPTCSFEAQLEVITALSKIKSVQALEFFSKVFNEETNTSNLKPDQLQKLKQRASEALQAQVMDL